MSKSKRKGKFEPAPEGETESTADSAPAEHEEEHSLSLPRTYQRASWRHFIRLVMLFPLILLNVATFMSFITRLEHHLKMMDPLQELFFFLMVGVVDLLFLFPMIFEVNKLGLEEDHLYVSTLLWRKTLKWEEITDLVDLAGLKYALMKTGRCFYLINRKELKPFPEIISNIRRMASLDDREQ